MYFPSKSVCFTRIAFSVFFCKAENTWKKRSGVLKCVWFIKNTTALKGKKTTTTHFFSSYQIYKINILVATPSTGVALQLGLFAALKPSVEASTAFLSRPQGFTRLPFAAPSQGEAPGCGGQL